MKRGDIMNFIVNPQTNITPYACSCKGINFGGSNSCSCDTKRTTCSCNTQRTCSCNTKGAISCTNAFGNSCPGLA